MNESKEEFDRGTVLSIFNSDRREDLMALVLALVIALFVYIAY